MSIPVYIRRVALKKPDPVLTGLSPTQTVAGHIFRPQKRMPRIAGVRHVVIGIQISNPPVPVLGSNSAP